MKRLLALSLLLCMGCTPAITMARLDGENLQWKSFMSIPGVPVSREVELKVKVVVVSSFAEMPIKGAAATYSIGDNQDRVIHIIGKRLGGKIILPAMYLGHEVLHALHFQDNSFVDPDKLESMGF